MRVSERLPIDKGRAGPDGGFEYFPHASPSVFTCIFNRQRDQALYRVDIDAASGAVVSVTPFR